jgi:hypothetical protein
VLCNIAPPDLEARLHGTTCLYQDYPYLITIDSARVPERVRLHDCVTQEFVKAIRPDDPEFDVATPPLGYIQVKKDRICYCERLPYRQFKQGVVYQVLGFKYYMEQFRLKMNSEAFRNTMARVYPPFKEIVSAVIKSKVYAEYALSNDCALSVSAEGVIKVFFKHEEVAFSTIAEFKKSKPIVHINPNARAWIIERYLSQFDWTLVQ